MSDTSFKSTQTVYDFAEIKSAVPHVIVKPKNYEELLTAVETYPYPISIAGGKYSHGGHTMSDGCLYLDLSELKHVHIHKDMKAVTVQAGCTWYDLIQQLDPYDLSVAEMQSYANFSVGGSISVNCHGRGLQYGTIADTILKMKVLSL